LAPRIYTNKTAIALLSSKLDNYQNERGDAMKRILLAALLGGIAMFAWKSIAHVALPLGQSGIHEIPNEQAVLGAMHSTLGETSGLYFFPAMGAAPGAMAEYDRKLAVNPSGLMIYHPPGAKSLTAAQMITELVTEMLEALLAAVLLSRTRISTYWGRVGFVTLLGVLASMATNLSYWNWYGFPSDYTAVYIMIEIVGFLCIGLVAARFVYAGQAALPAAGFHAARAR
jgi:hypothetical protein